VAVAALTLATLAPSGPGLAREPQSADASARPPTQFDAPAYIARVDGEATLQRDGRVEISPLNMPLLSGDRLRTSNGRVEVQYADGARLVLDTNTAVDLLADDLLRLADGRVRLDIRRTSGAQVSYRVDSAAGSAHIAQPGEYRIALLRGAPAAPDAVSPALQLELAVTSGGGEISTEQGATAVRAGERAYASAGLLPSYTYAYNSAIADDFDHWVDQQDAVVYPSTSASVQYLPSDLSGYASTFDQYGDWQYQQTYGYVWYPRVATDWHPYYHGTWASYPAYGWTWITADPFGYPTHHYGRWGVSGGQWFWIPATHWGPAYVSWAAAPGYVSWCPLGRNDHAVSSLGLYNVGPSYYAGHYGSRYASAWTTVTDGSFRRGNAPAHVMNWDRGASGVRPHFSESAAPAGGSPAIARGTAASPIRSAGTRTATAPARPIPATSSSGRPVTGAIGPMDRGTGQTPRYVNRGSEIVRSQTAQPIAPSGRAGARSLPPQPAAGVTQQPERRAWDNPAYRPPGYAPSYETRPTSAPQPRGNDRVVPRQEATPVPPRASERVSPGQDPRAPAQPRAESARPGAGAPSAAGAGAHAAPRAPEGRGEARGATGAGMPVRGRW
jgi:hypothetical protein